MLRSMLPARQPPYPSEIFTLMQTCEAWWVEHPELHSRPAILLVSGGVDSMCLWAALEMCMEAKGGANNKVENGVAFKNFVVAHIQYPYRRAAATEAQRLQTHARALGRVLELRVIEAPEDLKQENQEDQARRWRLAFCEELEKKYPNAFFMLGRHGQDQVEDFWLRVFRHPTPWTWQEPADISITQEYPLAPLSRRLLHTAYQQVAWPSFFDHTNTALHYRRNAVRHHLQKLQVAATPDRTDSDFETLCEFVPLAQSWSVSLRRACEEKMVGWLGESWQQANTLNLTPLKAHPDFLPVALWEWLTEHSRHKAGVNTTVYRQLVRTCLGKQFPKTFIFPQLGTVVVRAQQVMLH